MSPTGRRRHARLSPWAGYCYECRRFVYHPQHECPTTPSDHVLLSEIRRVAHDRGVALRCIGGTWVARDIETGEKASDHTPDGAWASLRNVEPAQVRATLDRESSLQLPTGALRLVDIDPESDA